MKKGILGLAAVCAGLVCLPAGSEAATFQAPARLGDRSVALQWAPDSDDPLFTGNLRLFSLGSMSVGTAEIKFLLFDRFGDRLWVLDAEADLVAGLSNADTTWVQDTLLAPLGLGTEVVCAALHPAGHLLVAGLADGRIAVWRPNESQEPEIFAAHDGRCRGLAFASLASERDSSFFSAGDDGRLIRWLRPGLISREQVIDEAGISAISLSPAADVCAIGHPDGKLGLWIAAGGFTLIVEVAAHPGHEVVQTVFSAQADRVASVDDRGGVRVWDARFGVSLGAGYDPAGSDPVQIAFTPRESELIPFVHRSGTLGALDGQTGMPFAIRTTLPREISAFAFSPDGRTSFLGGPGGQLDWWFQGACVPSVETPECFGGYLIMRGPTLDPEDMIFLRQYQYGDSTWPWTARDSLRYFVDPDSVITRGGDPEGQAYGPHNGVPFYYSLVKYYQRNEGGLIYRVFKNTREEGGYREDPQGEPVALIARYDAVTNKPLLDRVFVVPNPYIENDPLSHFGAGSPPLVRFQRLPETATIRIYTVSGDLVRTLDHRQTSGGEVGGSCPWDLRNADQREVASGVYIYAIETPSGEQRTGFLTLVR